jgi:hypothetical protein
VDEATVVAVIPVTTGGTTIVDMMIGGTTTEGKGSTTGGIEQFRLAVFARRPSTPALTTPHPSLFSRFDDRSRYDDRRYDDRRY